MWSTVTVKIHCAPPVHFTVQYKHILTSHTERPEAKLQAIQHDEAEGGVQFTGLLWVALKITGALPQPQFPDLSYVNWRREGVRKEGQCCMNTNMHNHKSQFVMLFISLQNTQESVAGELNKCTVCCWVQSKNRHTNSSAVGGQSMQRFLAAAVK